MQRGDGSKDTWILGADSSDENTSSRAQMGSIELRRGGTDLASRVADNLYWLGRYTERCESAVRLLRTVLSRLSDESALRASPALTRLVNAPHGMGLMSVAPGDLSAPGELERVQKEVMSAVFARGNSGGLRETFGRVHWIAASVRDRISPDVWRILNYLEHEAFPAGASSSFQAGEGIVLLNNIVTILAAFSGMEMENMVRGSAWRFLDVGRRLERAIFMLRLLRLTVTVEHEEEPALLEALLEVADSSMTYRARYFGPAHLAGVLDLLLFDENNPRSIAFQYAVILGHLDHLPQEQEDLLPSQAKKVILGGLANIRAAEMEKLAVMDENKVRVALDQLLELLTRNLPQFSDQLTLRYFSHAATARELNSQAVQQQQQ